MTDVEWAEVRPLLPTPGWMRGRGGRPEGYCHRAVLDAIRYLVDNGVKWRAMPADFPPWDRVYAFFRRWRDHALVKEFHDRLRGQVRERLGRDCACRIPRPCRSRGMSVFVEDAANAVVASYVEVEGARNLVRAGHDAGALQRPAAQPWQKWNHRARCRLALPHTSIGGVLLRRSTWP
ncbi:transposase [Streptomyces sp. NPDC021218]|uniref:transposase n=1 Tax=unclassified Streptomyces TaxID=2593676 RepID=UPI00368A25D8